MTEPPSEITRDSSFGDCTSWSVHVFRDRATTEGEGRGRGRGRGKQEIDPVSEATVQE